MQYGSSCYSKIDPAYAGTSTRLWEPQINVENGNHGNMSSSQIQANTQSHNLSTVESHSTHLSPSSQYPAQSVKVSLEHTPISQTPVPGFNVSPKPYHPREVNNNTPAAPAKRFTAPYANRAEQYLFEKGGLFGTDPAVMKAREPRWMNSEALKLIQEEEQNRRQSLDVTAPTNGITNRSASPAAGTVPGCFTCGKGIVGVMCRANNLLMHPECFTCSTCGSSLRNVGHHFYNEKFYCDVHGQQWKHQPNAKVPSPRPNKTLNPDLAVKTPPTAVHPVRVQEPPRGFYQPDVLAPGPLSPPQPPKRPPVETFARTSVYNNQTYRPESKPVNNEEPLVIGKLTGRPSIASDEARQMSRHFAPISRSKSVRGIQWPPAPDKSERSYQAIRYWKYPQETDVKEKKTLQDLIQEDEAAAKKNVREHPTTEKPKTNSKRVVPTPHRLLSPMRNPLDAYLEKVRSHSDISNSVQRTRSAVTRGPPPAVNVSMLDLAHSQSSLHGLSQMSLNRPSPNARSFHSDEADKEEQQLDNEKAQNGVTDNANGEEWHGKSEILEEKDILTEASSPQHSEADEITLNLPKFDERTSKFIEEHNVYDSPSASADDIDALSMASTIKDGDESLSLNEKDAWMIEELEQAQREQAMGHDTVDASDYDDFEDQLEQSCLRELAQDEAVENPIPEREQALKVIEDHQRNLQNQQDQLSQLLNNAIRLLRDNDIVPPGASEYLNVNEVQNLTMTQPSDVTTMRTPQADYGYHHQANQERSQYSYSSQQQRTVPPPIPPPPANNNLYADGIRQHGQLLNQTNSVPYCEQCKRQIRGAYVLATGMTWCPEHFTCSNPACNRRLLDTGFVEEKGKKYCEKCFETLIAPICNKCGMPITADCLTALQKQWHPECFSCHHCSNPFGNSAFYLENGRPYCERDWNALFTTKCISCKFPIEAGDRWVEAIGSAFHSNCFTCTVCQISLEGQSFYAKNGLPYCRIHA
uniref:LIM zinc-binding domain-containing protein n=1 Tax=Panagrellus redivivus TaxID=6233 RepID=A0A7E4VVP5_PANRE